MPYTEFFKSYQQAVKGVSMEDTWLRLDTD